MPPFISKFLSALSHRKDIDQEETKRIFFNSGVYPHNRYYMESMLLPGAIKNGGLFLVTSETAESIKKSISNLRSSLAKIEEIRFSSCGSIGELCKRLDKHLTVNENCDDAHDFYTTKKIVVVINDIEDNSFANQVCVKLRGYASDLFHSGRLLPQNNGNAVVLLENYNQYFLPGLSVVAAISRSLGLSFSLSSGYSEDSASDGELKQAYANCQVFAQ